MTASHCFNCPHRDFQSRTEVCREQLVNKGLKSLTLSCLFLHMYHNSVGLQTELCTRRLATTGNLLYAAPACSHTVLPRLPHSAGIKEGEENTPGYTSGTASEGVWQCMAEVQHCDEHPVVVSVSDQPTRCCFCILLQRWKQICVHLQSLHAGLRDDDTTALARRSVITKR